VISLAVDAAMPRIATVAVLLAVAVAPSRAAATPGGDEWKYDVVHLKKGEPLRGLIEEQGDRKVRIRCIRRRPGRPTIVHLEIIPHGEIARLELLSDADRAALQRRLDALKREWKDLTERLRQLDPRAKGATSSGDDIALEPVAWPLDDKVKALGFRSTYFNLVANSRPGLAQLAATLLEQVYAAYARFLPPRNPKARPTTILLTRTLAEYQAIARARRLNILNPAFYDPRRNEVVCGSDLERLSDEMEKVDAHHKRLREQVKERRAQLARVYGKKVPPELLPSLMDLDARISKVEAANTRAFARARDRLFRRLYHESFHAYLGTFVYPAAEGALPHWFNEGLAQIFETAIIELGELRVGHADPKRLLAVREALGNKPKVPLLPLTDLLRAKPEQFLVAHGSNSDKQVSDRYYLAAWALAFYLTFEQRVLGTPALDRYVHALKRGRDPLLAFRDLVGKPLPAFEKQYIDYLTKLPLPP
jgi:hypothetical protein